jgi:hypothetical protein
MVCDACYFSVYTICGNSGTYVRKLRNLWRVIVETPETLSPFSCYHFLVCITCHRHHTYLLQHTFTPHKYKCMKFMLCAHSLEKSILKFKISWHIARGSYICLYCACNNYDCALFNEDLSMLSSITKEGRLKSILPPQVGFGV